MFSNKHAAVCLLRGKNFADTVDGGDGDGDKFAKKQWRWQTRQKGNSKLKKKFYLQKKLNAIQKTNHLSMLGHTVPE